MSTRPATAEGRARRFDKSLRMGNSAHERPAQAVHRATEGKRSVLRKRNTGSIPSKNRM